MKETLDWIVLKFGGTSVAVPEGWRTIAEVVRARRQEGCRPLVVCSALGGVTDLLVRLADAQESAAALLGEIDRRHTALADALGVEAAAWRPLMMTLGRLVDEAHNSHLPTPPPLRAQILAQGELMATRLGTAFLANEGLRTHWHDARTALRATEEPRAPLTRRYLSAACAADPDITLQETLAATEADVCVTQGFIARNGAGETVLIGRGGSDTSAAYFAAKLQAARLEIWTDVPGLFTANPQIIPSARLLRHLGYDEAQELATMGAKVLHPRAVAPVRRFGIPLHVRSTAAPALEGTVVSDSALDTGPQVKAISVKAGVTLISMRTLGMWQEAGFLADVFGVFKRHGLSIDLVATSETEVTVSLDPLTNALGENVLDALVDDLGAFCTAGVIRPVAVVSLVGRSIRAILHRLGPTLEVFEDHRVYLFSQAASDLNVSFVVDEAQAERVARDLHARLFGTQPTGNVFGPSWRALTEPTAEAEPAEEEPTAHPWWHRRRDELLALAEESAPAYVYDEETLRAAAARLKALPAIDRVFFALKANAHPDVLRLFNEAGLGFECVSPGEVRRVQSALPDLDADRLLFTPNFAPRAEYAFGLDAGAHVTLDNLYPLRAWPDLFGGREIILRMDPGHGRGHHAHVRTAGDRSKFGIALGAAGEAQRLAERAGARVVGLHAHVGSGIVAAKTWAETAQRLAALTERFPEVRFLNVGGGFGVAEQPGGAGLDLGAVAESLGAFKEARPDLELWIEPGRLLVAEAGVLLARVTQIKQKGEGVHYVGIETGMNSLLRPALYGAYHAIRNLTHLSEPDAMTAEVVGPICETGDVLGHSRRLPATEEGDCLVIATAGAYGHTMSSHYNGRPPAGEVLLRAAVLSG